MNEIQFAYQHYCKKRFPLPSERQVADLESRIEVGLPPDFRQYILEFNGGWFNEPRITPGPNGCPADRLSYLSGIGASHRCAELASPADLALFDDNRPMQILPIGYTLMGNLLLLVVASDGTDRGHILLKKAFSDQSFFLADGIVDFFKLLQSPSEDQ